MIYLPTLLPLVLETLSILKSSLRLLAMPGTTGGENKWNETHDGRRGCNTHISPVMNC